MNYAQSNYEALQADLTAARAEIERLTKERGAAIADRNSVASKFAAQSSKLGFAEGVLIGVRAFLRSLGNGHLGTAGDSQIYTPQINRQHLEQLIASCDEAARGKQAQAAARQER